jgi:hypothetical protein
MKAKANPPILATTPAPAGRAASVFARVPDSTEKPGPGLHSDPRESGAWHTGNRTKTASGRNRKDPHCGDIRRDHAGHSGRVDVVALPDPPEGACSETSPEKTKPAASSNSASRIHSRVVDGRNSGPESSSVSAGCAALLEHDEAERSEVPGPENRQGPLELTPITGSVSNRDGGVRATAGKVGYQHHQAGALGGTPAAGRSAFGNNGVEESAEALQALDPAARPGKHERSRRTSMPFRSGRGSKRVLGMGTVTRALEGRGQTKRGEAVALGLSSPSEKTSPFNASQVPTVGATNTRSSCSRAGRRGVKSEQGGSAHGLEIEDLTPVSLHLHRGTSQGTSPFSC